MESSTAVETKANILTTFINVSENTIYLMGFSFILGSLFTILVLILLDFMRRNSDNASKED